MWTTKSAIDCQVHSGVNKGAFLPAADRAVVDLHHLRAAIEASGEVVFMTDRDGTIIFVNPRFVEVYGYQPADVIGRATPRVLKSGQTAREEYAGFWQSLLNKRVVTREFVNRTKDGRLLQIESSANPIFSETGELVGFLAVQRDITARRQMEAALRDSEARYRLLAEAAQDDIFVVNRDMTLQYVNIAGARRCGLSVDEAIGKRLDQLWPPAVANTMCRKLTAVLAANQPHHEEDRFTMPSGEVWLSTWLVPIARDGGDAEAVLGVARDITKQKHLEAEFLQAQKMEAVGRLAGGVAHDFNNLLTAILGYADLLSEQLSADDPRRADVQEITKAGQSAALLTRQLLAFSRRQILQPAVLSLNDVVRDAQGILKRLIGEDVAIVLDLAPDLGPVMADRGGLEQVIMNLAVNARDAMPHGGRLTLKTENVQIDESQGHIRGIPPGRYVLLALSDTGSGISPEVQAHLFEPFFTTKGPDKGTGLGLATVYGIVKQSHGCIWSDSEPARGATFTILLPLMQLTVKPVYQPAPTEPESLAGSETILLVEDHAVLRDLVRRTLQRFGYRVLTADGAEAALDLCARERNIVDLLITDVVLPGLSGPALADQLKARWPQLRTLLVSGYTADNVVHDSVVDGRRPFLQKPFTPETIARKVRMVFNSPA